MEKYKELLKEIICYSIISKSDFIAINEITFQEYGVTVFYEYYPFSNSNETAIDSVDIYNSQLNAYMYEKLK